ncbi:hypothetical protein DFH11DRAFT_1743510 [Phellopilus nigrolimitatus]|nr:hypothetical protein DFH11DRAFT_1743510 [Phellopilus nigrolimitatus]
MLYEWLVGVDREQKSICDTTGSATSVPASTALASAASAAVRTTISHCEERGQAHARTQRRRDGAEERGGDYRGVPLIPSSSSVDASARALCVGAEELGVPVAQAGRGASECVSASGAYAPEPVKEAVPRKSAGVEGVLGRVGIELPQVAKETDHDVDTAQAHDKDREGRAEGVLDVGIERGEDNEIGMGREGVWGVGDEALTKEERRAGGRTSS